MIALALWGCGSSTPALPASDAHWVTLAGGTFAMGSVDGGPFGHAGPQHEVTVPAFQIQRHEALSSDYHRCVEAGDCPKVPQGMCAQGDDPQQPQNCLTWNGAEAVCRFLGARLPSESEWEFAATSAGQPGKFPWGDAPPDCTRANVAVGEAAWCPGPKPMWDVCTHPAGDTPNGICEMGGNLFEWTADRFLWDYTDHVRDGSPQRVGPSDERVMRGGGIGSAAGVEARTRTYHPPQFEYAGLGVRCARDVPTGR